MEPKECVQGADGGDDGVSAGCHVGVGALMGPGCWTSLLPLLAPQAVVAPAPHAPLVLGLPLAHSLATCPGVVCCPALLCAVVGFPGEQISARAWTEQRMVSN